jgi:hypothetical protein
MLLFQSKFRGQAFPAPPIITVQAEGLKQNSPGTPCAASNGATPWVIGIHNISSLYFVSKP